MKKMLALTGRQHVAYFPANADGKEEALQFRADHQAYFKYARIKEVLQGYPSRITYGSIYKLGYRRPRSVIPEGGSQ